MHTFACLQIKYYRHVSLQVQSSSFSTDLIICDEMKATAAAKEFDDDIITLVSRSNEEVSCRAAFSSFQSVIAGSQHLAPTQHSFCESRCCVEKAVVAT